MCNQAPVFFFPLFGESLLSALAEFDVNEPESGAQVISLLVNGFVYWLEDDYSAINAWNFSAERQRFNSIIRSVPYCEDALLFPLARQSYPLRTLFRLSIKWGRVLHTAIRFSLCAAKLNTFPLRLCSDASRIPNTAHKNSHSDYEFVAHLTHATLSTQFYQVFCEMKLRFGTHLLGGSQKLYWIYLALRPLNCERRVLSVCVHGTMYLILSHVSQKPKLLEKSPKSMQPQKSADFIWNWKNKKLRCGLNQRHDYCTSGWEELFVKTFWILMWKFAHIIFWESFKRNEFRFKMQNFRLITIQRNLFCWGFPIIELRFSSFSIVQTVAKTMEAIKSESKFLVFNYTLT